MSKEDQATLQEAANIHEEAVEIAASIKDQKAAVMNKMELLKKQDTLSAADSVFLTKAMAIERAQKWYDDNHVEVPGFGHDDHDHSDHDHAHDHDHDHGPGLELTPDDMLLVQKEFRDTIIKIRQMLTDLQ